MAAFLAACAGTTTEVIREVPVEVIKEVQVAGETVIKTVEVAGQTREVEVVKEVEVIKEVEVTKEVTVEKIVEVMPDNPKAASLVIGLPEASSTDDLDASQALLFQTKIMSFALSDSMLLYDYNSQSLKPRLAESWEVAPDAQSMVFNLRQGVKWHNGDDFTAEDVKFNFDRIFDENDPHNVDGTFYYNNFAQPFYESTEVLDSHTVRLNLNAPDALIAEKFGALDSVYMAHPASVIEHGNRAYSLDPDKYIGTGPYIPVEVLPAERVRMVRNENFWGPRPDFDELIFQIFPAGRAGEDARVNALLAGELDLVLYAPAHRRNDLFTAEGIVAKWFPTFVLGYFYLNHTLPLFQDKLVRQAVARSFDRKTFHEATAGPTSIPWGNFWFPGSPFLNEDAELNYDPEKVAALMTEAGFTSGGDGVWAKADGTRAAFKIQYRAQPGEAPDDLSTFWQQGMNDLGFDVELESYDPGIRLDFEIGPLAEKNLHIVEFGVGVFLGDPAFAYQRFTSDDQFALSYMKNADLDRMYDQILREGDVETRLQIVKEMQTIIADEVGWVPNNVRTLGAAWRADKVTNVTVGATQYSYPWTYKVSPV